MGLRVLMTNLSMANFTGAETVLDLLADALRRVGHEPFVFAPRLGRQAERLRQRGFLVVDRLGALPVRPDVLHLQHAAPAMMALAAFPEVPAIYVCHSPWIEAETPPLHPQIRRYVAVSDLGRLRCLQGGVPAERLSVILNAVDLERFRQRAPLPAWPARALLLTKHAGHRAAVSEACAGAGIALEEIGRAAGKVSENLEHDLPNYDLVFANGRMALEAAAVGCAVVVCDEAGFAGPLTSANFDHFRRHNMAVGVQVHPTTVEAVSAAIASYDPQDAGRVSRRVREEAGMEGAAASYVALYDSALKEPPATREEAAKAMAAFLEEALPSTAHRSWRRAAKELAQMEALDSASYVLDAEARLRSDVDQRLQAAEARVRHYLFQQSASLGQLLENAGGEIRSQEARLKEELGNQILKLGRRLNEDVQAIGAELQHRGDQIRSELEQRLREMGAGQHQEIRSMSSSIEATTSAAVRDAVDASADRLIRHLAERAQRLEAMVERVRAERRDTLPRRLYRRLVPSAIRRPLHALRARIHQAVQR